MVGEGDRRIVGKEHRISFSFFGKKLIEMVRNIFYGKHLQVLLMQESVLPFTVDAVAVHRVPAGPGVRHCQGQVTVSMQTCRRTCLLHSNCYVETVASFCSLLFQKLEQ